MVTLMQELNRVDRPLEKPTYSNAEVAELHQNGLLSRAEAEVLDIIHSGFVQNQEDDTDLTRSVEEQWEPSCVAIVHEGVVIPVLNLEEIVRRPRTSAENLAVCKQVASVIYDVLLTLLEENSSGEE